MKTKSLKYKEELYKIEIKAKNEEIKAINNYINKLNQMIKEK